MAKIFKGFKQVSAAKFEAAQQANTLDGYIWFVRTAVLEGEETESLNNVANDSYDIYFGSRHYGHFCEGELDNIKSAITALEGDVDGILETLENLTGVLEAQDEAIKANANAIEANAGAIETLANNLAGFLVKSVDPNDKVLNLADGILSGTIGLEYTDGEIRLTGKVVGEGEDAKPMVISSFSASDFVKDSVLEDVEVQTKEDGEKYIVFTWKTEGEETKTDEIKVSDFAKLYNAGTALELAEDGVTFNVKIAENDNFLSVNANNELIVDDMTVDKAKIKEDITIEGGPLASDAVKAAFNGGVIPAGTDIQSVLKALLCVEIYPEPTANTPSYSVSIEAPSVTANVNNNALVEVGQSIVFNTVTAKQVSVSKVEPKVDTFKHGYSSGATENDVIVNNTAITATWTVEQMENNVYELSASIVKGFTNGVVPTTVQNAVYSECVLSGCTLVAVEGENKYKVTEDAPKHTGSHNGIESAYIVSNLGGRSSEHMSPSIAAESDVQKDPANSATTFTVTAVYPIFTNGVTASTTDATGAAMADLAAPVEGDGTKLALMKTGTTFAVSFANQGLEPYKLFLPGSWKVSSALAINPTTAKYAVDCKDKFVANATKVTRTIQGKEVSYTVYEWASTEGPNRVKFTVA